MSLTSGKLELTADFSLGVQWSETLLSLLDFSVTSRLSRSFVPPLCSACRCLFSVAKWT